MKDTMFYDAKREAKTLETTIGTELLNIVDECYVFHPQKTITGDLLEGVTIHGNMKVAMQKEQRTIPKQLHADAIASGIILYSYKTGMAYVLSKNAVADLFCEMGISGRMTKIPFIERDLYLSTLMDYYRGTYRGNVKVIFRDMGTKVKFVIALRKKNYTINPSFKVMEAVEDLVSSTNYAVTDYDMLEAVDITLSCKGIQTEFIPTVFVRDSVDGNSSMLIRIGYLVGKENLFITVKEAKFSHHNKNIDWKTFSTQLLEMSNQLLRWQTAWDNERDNRFAIDLAELWKMVEKAAAMKKNKRSVTHECIEEMQGSLTTFGEYKDLFVNAVEGFDYTNDSLALALGVTWHRMLEECGIVTREEVNKDASS